MSNLSDVISDCCVDIFNEKPSKRAVKYIRECLPNSIIIAAEEWGATDTLVREEIYEWVSKKIASMEELKDLSE